MVGRNMLLAVAAAIVLGVVRLALATEVVRSDDLCRTTASHPRSRPT